jgi:ribosomal protein S27E
MKLKCKECGSFHKIEYDHITENFICIKCSTIKAINEYNKRNKAQDKIINENLRNTNN